MRHTRVAAALLIVFWTGAASAADCTLNGAPPAVPNGATASEAEMVAAQQAVKQFVALTQEYTQCLELSAKGNLRGADAKAFDDANEQMQKLAKDFNKELKAFKSR